MPVPLPFTSFRAAFAGILRALCAALAVRGTGRTPIPMPMLLAIVGRILRASHRFANLLARFRAGGPMARAARARPSARPSASPSGPPPAGPRAAPALRLPRRWGWLLPLLPVDAAVAGSQLGHLLAQPELAGLIAGSPGLARLLRPLARMLAMDLPAPLQPPRRAAKPRPEPVRRTPPPQHPGPQYPGPPDRLLPSRRPSIVVQGSRLRRIVYGPG